MEAAFLKAVPIDAQKMLCACNPDCFRCDGKDTACRVLLQVRPELVSVGHSVRKAALSVPLLGWFARTPAEDEALQRVSARAQRRGRFARDEHDEATAQPPPGKQ